MSLLESEQSSRRLPLASNFAFFVVLVTLWLWPLGYARYVGIDPASMLDVWLTCTKVISGFAALFGVAFNSNVFPIGDYEEWLRASPWRRGRPLPLGRLGPTGWAWGWVGVSVAICLAVGVWPWPTVVGLALLGCVLTLDRPRVGPQKLIGGLRYATLFLLLLAVWVVARGDAMFPPDERLAIGVLLLLFAAAGAAGFASWTVAWRGTDLGLPPAEAIGWPSDSPEGRAAMAGVVLWPAPAAPDPRPPRHWVGVVAKAAVAFPLGAVAAVVLQYLGADPPVVWTLTIAAVFVVLLVRGPIISDGRISQSPLKLRLRTRRLVVPRRDVRWVGSLVGAAAMFWTGLLAAWLGAATPEAVGLAWAAVTACVFGCGPSRRWVDLCADGVLRRVRERAAPASRREA